MLSGTLIELYLDDISPFLCEVRKNLSTSTELIVEYPGYLNRASQPTPPDELATRCTGNHFGGPCPGLRIVTSIFMYFLYV